MPRNKDLKRLVRARMKKTGEAYTSARAQITRKAAAAPALAKNEVIRDSSPSATRRYAELAGMSDASIKKGTGCTWERWVVSLDYHGAEAMSHREIADLVKSKYKVADWWTQMVTVGYERIKGLRARGQRRDGSFDATKSRTFNVPVATLFDAWAKPARRKKWLDATGVKVRTATPHRSIRLALSDGAIVAVGFTAKGKLRSAVAVQHGKLPSLDAAQSAKEYWTAQLDALRSVLEPG